MCYNNSNNNNNRSENRVCAKHAFQGRHFLWEKLQVPKILVNTRFQSYLKVILIMTCIVGIKKTFPLNVYNWFGMANCSKNYSSHDPQQPLLWRRIHTEAWIRTGTSSEWSNINYCSVYVELIQNLKILIWKCIDCMVLFRNGFRVPGSMFTVN